MVASTIITVALPVEVVNQLNELVPTTQRDQFITEALQNRLQLAEQLLALEESAGAWTDPAHPEMDSEQAIDLWLSSLRNSWASGREDTNGNPSD